MCLFTEAEINNEDVLFPPKKAALKERMQSKIKVTIMTIDFTSLCLSHMTVISVGSKSTERFVIANSQSNSKGRLNSALQSHLFQLTAHNSTLLPSIVLCLQNIFPGIASFLMLK